MYIFDTNSLRIFGNYYPQVFPSFWSALDDLVSDGRFWSVREVRKELDLQNPIEHLAEWAQRQRGIFTSPTANEMAFVKAIFEVPHFQQLIGEKQRLRGLPVADPFVVAKAQAHSACVVTEESVKPNAAKVPNVCAHFGVKCLNVQGFLAELGWRF